MKRLFGHEGAYTGHTRKERTSGTGRRRDRVFDEIGDLDLNLQKKLLRFSRNEILVGGRRGSN
jgi:transcriptional regulator with GAF, ATPase, and Fis domain